MEEFDFYPPKPELVEKKSRGGASRSIFSLLLFVLVFLLIGVNDLSFILVLVLILLVHEMGHFTMMKFFKYSDIRMLFVPLLGAFVQGKKEEYLQKESIMVVLAGPIPGIAIGILLMYYGHLYRLDSVTEVSFLFLCINMLNLLPLDPLDGGQLLKLLIKNNQEKFQLVFSFISSLVLIGFGWIHQLWIIVVFGFVMGLRVRAIQKNYQIHKDLEEEDVNFKTTYSRLSNKDFSSIKRVMLNYTPALRTYINQVSTETVDPIVADQVNNVLVSPLMRNTSLFFRTTVVLVWIAAFVLPIVFSVWWGVIQI
jgi:stage IV sporulation protein FB